MQLATCAVRVEAPSAKETDRPHILGRDGVLERLGATPGVSLNGAVAAATVQEPATGPALLESPEKDARPKDHHRLSFARRHLRERAGDPDRP
ncbi:hypothetical protein [Streptomyces xantholiticus]|uniref:Uncharacterized protein n=1 Tax=Streptomyces xantholiticus TaxID=68285 RepID=A0ABV1V1Y2_9ACTN